MEHNEYISTLKHRLNERKYLIEEGGKLNSQPIDILARRSKFKFKRYSHIKTSFILANFSTFSIDALQQFSDHCFEYTWQSQRLSWILYVRPFPMREIIVCPIITVAELDSDAATEVHKMPAIRRSNGILFPIVVDLKSEQLHFSDDDPSWSMFMYDSAKTLAKEFAGFSKVKI